MFCCVSAQFGRQRLVESGRQSTQRVLCVFLRRRHFQTSAWASAKENTEHALCRLPARFHQSLTPELGGYTAKHPSSMLNSFSSTNASIRRSEEHTSELQSHSFISYAVFCLKKTKKIYEQHSDALRRYRVRPARQRSTP